MEQGDGLKGATREGIEPMMQNRPILTRRDGHSAEIEGLSFQVCDDLHAIGVGNEAGISGVVPKGGHSCTREVDEFGQIPQRFGVHKRFIALDVQNGAGRLARFRLPLHQGRMAAQGAIGNLRIGHDGCSAGTLRFAGNVPVVSSHQNIVEHFCCKRSLDHPCHHGLAINHGERFAGKAA